MRCAYEFQSQRCTALSRPYVPRSMWDAGPLKAALVREAAKMTHGDDPKWLHHPLGPLVSAAAFERFGASKAQAPRDGHNLLYGTVQRGKRGFFVQPAIFEVSDP